MKGKQFGKIDFLLHSTAFAPAEDMAKDTVDTSRQRFLTAMDFSGNKHPNVNNKLRLEVSFLQRAISTISVLQKMDYGIYLTLQQRTAICHIRSDCKRCCC